MKLNILEMKSDWKAYEDFIFDELAKKFPGEKITPDVRIVGQFSEIERQLDITAEGTLAGKPLLVVIDCKHFSKKINIKVVESFIGLLEDVKASSGIMITNGGYTKGAMRRATKNPRSVHLDIVPFSKLSDYYFDFGDNCPECATSGRSFPSKIVWSETETLIKGRGSNDIMIGSCDYCGDILFKCIKCGCVLGFHGRKETDCGCGIVYERFMENLGSGMEEYRVKIKSFSSPHG